MFALRLQYSQINKMDWIYYKEGEPLWEATSREEEQSVMFYCSDGPFSSGFPPMSDKDWGKLNEYKK